MLEILQLKNPTKFENKDASDDRVEFEDLIEGVVFCDYTAPNFESKPDPEFYRKVTHIVSWSGMSMLIFMHQALMKANVTDPSKCLFVDDSRVNVDAAKREGWGRCVYFREHHESESADAGKSARTGSGGHEVVLENGIPVISDLEGLRFLWPDIFKDL